MSKYYIPELWEFHIGFEYQIHRGYDDFVEGRRSVIEMGVKFVDKKYCKYGSLIVMSNLLVRDADYIRVKYLDREDIEGLGFEVIQDSKDWLILKGKSKIDRSDVYIQVEQRNPKRLTITNWEEYEDNHNWFQGECRNKSEFKRILTSIGYEVHSD